MNLTPPRESPSWLAVVAMAIALVGLSAVDEQMRSLLRLDAQWYARPWQLWTGHLVHLSLEHAGLNAATLLLFAALFPDLRRPAVLVVSTAILCLGVDIGVLFLDAPAWYVGFSGVVYGLAAVGLVLDWGRPKSLAPLFTLGLAAKLAIDAVRGTPATTVALVGGSVLSAAHIYGVVTGLGVGALLRARRPAAPRE